jgi:hypothetical protein
MATRGKGAKPSESDGDPAEQMKLEEKRLEMDERKEALKEKEMARMEKEMAMREKELAMKEREAEMEDRARKARLEGSKAKAEMDEKAMKARFEMDEKMRQARMDDEEKMEQMREARLDKEEKLRKDRLADDERIRQAAIAEDDRQRQIRSAEAEEALKHKEKMLELDRLDFAEKTKIERLSMSDAASVHGSVQGDVGDVLNGSVTGVRANICNAKIDITKLLPSWVKGGDKIALDDHLSRFEFVCRQNNFTDDGAMAALFMAKADHELTIVLQDMTLEETGSFAKITELLKGYFRLTPEDYRRKFRSITRKPEESYAQFATRLAGTFDKWMKARDATDNADAMRFCLLMEPFMQATDEGLANYILDKEPTTIVEAASYADNYVSRRSSTKKDVNKESAGGRRWERPRSYSAYGKNRGGRGGQTQKKPNPASAGPKGTVPPGSNPGGNTNRGNNVSGSTGRTPIVCFYCKKEGHVKAECYSYKRMLSMQPPGGSAEKVSGVNNVNVIADMNAILQNDNINENSNTHQHPYVQGASVRGTLIELLRDTGADISLIKNSLVGDGDYTGSHIYVRPILSRQILRLPLAKVSIESPSINGLLSFAVADADTMKYDVIIGNDLADVCPVSIGAVTRLKTGTFIKRPARYLDDDGDVDALDNVDNVSDIPIDNIVDDNDDDNVDDIPDVIADVDDRVGLEPMTMPSADPILIDGIDIMGDSDVTVDDVDRPDDVEPRLFLSVVSRDEFCQSQRNDLNLAECYRNLEEKESEKELLVGIPRFYEKDGLLRRMIRIGEEVLDQICLPVNYYKQLFWMAHDSAVAGHAGVSRCYARLTRNFWAPKLRENLKDYIRSCQVCQTGRYSGGKVRYPLQSIVVPVQEAMYRVGIDLIENMPRSTKGNTFALVLVDYATRFPDVLPLPAKDAETVASGLITMFVRWGYPKEVLSDQGSQFMSRLFDDLFYKAGIKHLTTTAYAPSTNGLVERFNKTLKGMVLKFAEGHPERWDDQLDAFLFAYRTVPQASSGFSPFHLMFGRECRTPISLLADTLDEPDANTDTITEVEFVCRLQERLMRELDAAGAALENAQHRQRELYNRKAAKREFQVGDKVLYLWPRRQSKFGLRWLGPAVVRKRVRECNYVVYFQDEDIERFVHINMLKKYHDRPAHLCGVSKLEKIEEETTEELLRERLDPEDSVGYSLIEQQKAQEAKELPIVPASLSPGIREEAEQLLREYQDIFSYLPGECYNFKYVLTANTAKLRHQRAYRCAQTLREPLRQELESLKSAGIISEVVNPLFCAPLIVIPKKDGKLRLVIDYRELNDVTPTEPYTLNRIDELISNLGENEFVSTFDMSKGYFQIPLTDESKILTAFICAF